MAREVCLQADEVPSTLTYASCPPSRNHVSVKFKTFGPRFKRNPRRNKMPLVSMRQLLDEAAKGGYGVGAFNVNNMEQIQSIMEAARETNAPVLVADSAGGGYGVGAFNVNNMEQIQSIMEAARETKSPVIVQASRGARAYSQ